MVKILLDKSIVGKQVTFNNGTKAIVDQYARINDKGWIMLYFTKSVPVDSYCASSSWVFLPNGHWQRKDYTEARDLDIIEISNEIDPEYLEC